MIRSTAALRRACPRLYDIRWTASPASLTRERNRVLAASPAPLTAFTDWVRRLTAWAHRPESVG